MANLFLDPADPITNAHPLKSLPPPPWHTGTHLLHVAPGLPVAADPVPLLRGANDQVRGQQRPQIGGVVAWGGEDICVKRCGGKCGEERMIVI